MNPRRLIPPRAYWCEIAVWPIVLGLVLAAAYTGLTTAMNQ